MNELHKAVIDLSSQLKKSVTPMAAKGIKSLDKDELQRFNYIKTIINELTDQLDYLHRQDRKRKMNNEV